MFLRCRITDDSGYNAPVMDRAAPFIPSFTEQNWQPLDQARNAVFQLDDEGRVLDVNDTACQWLGYSREELLQMTVFDIDPLIKKENWQARRDNLRKHRSLSARSQHRRKDGTMYPIELTTTYVEAGDQSYSITVVQDITQRRAIEDQLLKVVEQFSEAQRVAHVGSWEWTVGTDQETWSDEMFRIFGYEPGQIPITTEVFLQHVHPEDRDQVNAMIKQALEEGGHFVMEFRMFRRDGSMRHCQSRGRVLRDESGRPVRVIGISQDVTEQRQSQMELEAMAHRLNEAQKIAHVGSWEWNLETRTAQWSDENYRLFGYEPGEVDPSPQFVISRVHPEDRPRFTRHFEQFAQGQAPFDFEYRLLQPDGSLRYIHSRGQAVRDRTGKVVRLIGAAMDMTARHEAQIEIEALAHRLNEAQKIAHVGSWEWVPTEDSVFWSEELYRIFGYPPSHEHMSFEQAISHLHINNMDQLRQYLEAARQEGKPFNIEMHVTRPNGEICYCHGRGQPVIDATGKVCMVYGTVQDVTERVLAQRQLEAAMNRLDEAQRVASIGTWEWDLLKQTAFWTEEMYRIYRRDPNDPIDNEKAMAAVHPEDRPRVKEVVMDALTRPESFEIEHRVLLPDGSVRYCLGRGQVVHNEHGEAVRVFGTSQDVTERKLVELALRRSEEHYRRAAETNRRLLSEVNHRVRNNLTGLLSLLRITREEADSVEQFATLMEQRITAMSKAHNLLADAHWQSLDLLALIRSAAGGYCSDDSGRTTCSGPPTQISPRQVVPLSLALHELFINAAKYGCHSAPSGRLNITWRHDQRRLVLKWCETAGPRIEQPVKPSLGTELIRGFICFELGGTLELNFPPQGANHVLSIPLERAND